MKLYAGWRSYCQETHFLENTEILFLEDQEKKKSAGCPTSFILTFSHNLARQEGGTGKVEKNRWGAAALDVGGK